MKENKAHSQEALPLQLEGYAKLIHLYEPFHFEKPAAPLTSDEAVNAMLTVFLEEQESGDQSDTSVFSAVEKRRLLQHLLTIRPAEPFLSSETHRIIDQILQAELQQKTLTEASNLPTIAEMFPTTTYPVSDKTALWKGDISTLKIDAIVNASNHQMLGCFQPFHACIDNVIHAAAGPRLREDCHRIMKQQRHLEGTGWAKVTRGYNLPSRFVLHTVGPVVPQGRGAISSEQQAQLVASYQSCLELVAQVAEIRTVAFCCISTGVFGFPQEPAAQTALDTISNWLMQHPQTLDLIIFNVFTDIDLQIYCEKLS